MQWKGWETGFVKEEQKGDTFQLGRSTLVETGPIFGVPAKGEMSVAWEGKALVTRFSMEVGGKTMPCMVKRTLENKITMCVKLLCADFTCTRHYLQVDKEGDILLNPDVSGNVWSKLEQFTGNPADKVVIKKKPEEE